MNTKSQLLAEVARSRAAILRDTESVRREVDIAAKFQNSVRTRPFAWLGSAAAIGYIIAGPKTRTKTVTKFVPGKSHENKAPVRIEKKHNRSLLEFFLSLVRLLLPVVRPALSAYAARRLGDFAEKFAK